VLAALVGISAFLFVTLQPRNVRVLADGQEVVVETHRSNDMAVLQAAGVELQPGDRVTEIDNDFLRVERAIDVRLVVDSEIYALRTHSETIEEVLAEANVVLEQRDSVLQNGKFVSVRGPVEPPSLLAVSDAIRGTPTLTPAVPIEIEVRRAVPFTIVDGGLAVETISSRPTIAQALREAAVTVGPGDIVTPDPEAPLVVDTRIEIRRASAVTIALPTGHRVVYTLAATVRDVLDEEGIVLPEGAFVDPSFDSPVTNNLRVRVVQLGSSADEEIEYIESSTVYRVDSSLDPGETRTVEGRDGIRTRRYAISYVDGAEVGRELVSDVIDPEPADTVIYYSERTQAPPPRPTADAPVAGTTLSVYAVAYNAASAGRSPDDPNYGITATGVRVTWGVIAVDPTVIPLGTRMYIPGYGYGVAADTGGGVKGYLIDLGYPDGVPIDWLSRWVEITILE
jgi:uncharacterized protein YabE (DUF348 family)